MNYAYLRISTDSQDVDNQRHGILEYANRHNLTGLNFVEDTVSGKKKWKDRKLGELVDTLVKGDVIIFAEISRMARSALQVLEILEICISRGISVHITKQNIVLDGSLQAKIMATMLGLAAEIERDFISMRTTEALAARKAAGQTLGRPRGPAEKLKLDRLRPDIEKYLRKDLSVRSIAKLIDQPVTTVHDYVKRYKLKDKILEPQL
ncbi:resolvase (plasmid) [Moritella marina ATCC 15381]|uniref:Resolvase n=1 Tax=Moritella marina ATCC 15381 TaxID=1202962 RepID=A0A5J6WGT4_MORMI|nr:recombinase family protein [Moritella marina]QFI36321.1 resolvase [Moritella marina ATCC 15381]